MMTTKSLTGQSIEHLVVMGSHLLHPETKAAFLAMQSQAEKAGFNLQPASAFRSFQRQQTIWNEKFCGLRPLLDKHCQPLDIHLLNTEERCKAILHWSALPGASRHHWGSDLDIYDPSLLPDNQRLRLEPDEYEAGGYFYALSEWLTQHMAEYGFYRPFQNKNATIASEPWHISHQPVSQLCEQQLTPEVLLQSWTEEEIAGYDWIVKHLNEIFALYIKLSTC